MGTVEPTRTDFELLSKYYLEAVQSLPQIKEGPGGPVYPRAIDNFFGYLRHSIWFSGEVLIGGGGYTFRQVLPNASFEDIGNILHTMFRAEHWGPGAWQGYLEDGDIKALVDRADFLTTR